MHNNDNSNGNSSLSEALAIMNIKTSDFDEKNTIAPDEEHTPRPAVSKKLKYFPFILPEKLPDNYAACKAVYKLWFNEFYWIGSSTKLKMRVDNHSKEVDRKLRLGLKENDMYSRIIPIVQEYSIDSFRLEVLEVVQRESQLLEVEQKYLDLSRADDFLCLNTSFTARRGGEIYIKERYVLKISPQTHVRQTKNDKIFFQIPEQQLWDTGKKRKKALKRYYDYKDYLYLRAREANFDIPPGYFQVIFHIPVFYSWPEKKKIEMHMQPHLSKPDADNLGKAFLDALKKKDQTVWDIRFTKVWENGPVVKERVPDPKNPGKLIDNSSHEGYIEIIIK